MNSYRSPGGDRAADGRLPGNPNEQYTKYPKSTDLDPWMRTQRLWKEYFINVRPLGTKTNSKIRSDLQYHI